MHFEIIVGIAYVAMLRIISILTFSSDFGITLCSCILGLLSVTFLLGKTFVSSYYEISGLREILGHTA